MSTFLSVVKSIPEAIRLFSRIPLPGSKKSDDDLSYTIAFLPLIGVVIALIQYYVNLLLIRSGFSLFIRCTAFIAIPLIITGGFHVDGFMDTEDARRSYADRKKKLAILSDPHIGAFSVISLVIAVLSSLTLSGIVLEINDRATVALMTGFVISRSLAALTSMYINPARPDDMLVYEIAGSKKVIYFILYVWLVLAFSLAAVADRGSTLAVAALQLFHTYRYKMMTQKEFGGVVGDTAGYFVVCSELYSMLAVAAVCLLRANSINIL